MPSIKRKVCPKHGIYNTKSCELCKKQTAKTYNQQSRNKDSSAIYNTTRWRKVRIQQLLRNPLCKCGKIATIADHVKELKDGGEPFSFDNLESMCISCHNTKTAREKRVRNAR